MADLSLIEWAAPGPYRVAFSTRIGGVSEGDFASLNLGILTEDDPARVVENRTRLCDAVGADPDGATMAWQRHGATVTRAQPRGIVTPGTVYDALRRACGPTSRAARCCCSRPTACRSRSRDTEGEPPGRRDPARRLARPARRHRRGGRARARRARRSPPRSARASARAATRSATRSRRRSARRSATTSCATASSTSGRRPSARSAPPASSSVDRFDLCTVLRAGDRFFSHRRDHGTHRPPGSHRLRRLSEIRERYERVRDGGRPRRHRRRRDEVRLGRGPGRARRGRRRGGRREPRAGPRRRSTTRYGDAFRWHFIGHLQSRKAKIVNEICELCHSLDSESAARKLDDPGARRGEPLGRGDEVGRRAGGAAGASRALPRRPRPDDDAAVRRDDPEASRPYFRAPARARRASTACASSRWGRARTTASPPRRARPTSGSASSPDGRNRRDRSNIPRNHELR